MNNPIRRTVFDSRDLVEYRDELIQDLINDYNNNIEDETEHIDDFEEIKEEKASEFGLGLDYEEAKKIIDFCEEINDNSEDDVEDGVAIIHEDYFTEYTEGFCEDCGFINDDLPGFIENNIDWEGVADELKMDYSEVEFEGSTYFMR